MYYLGFDLETTGLNVMNDEPVQFAGMVFDSAGRCRRSLSFYINTDVPIQPGAQAVHKITKEKIQADGFSCALATERYTELVWEFQPITLFGFNAANFDFPMWQNFMLKHKAGMFKHPPVIGLLDVMHMCSVEFKTRKWPKLSVAAKTLGIAFKDEDLHDAKADIELTWKVLECLYKKAGKTL
jgi:DNA polymerase III epsilon subunit-like protein